MCGFKTFRLIILVSAVSFIFDSAYAQVDQAMNVFGFKLLNYQDNYLPENILSSRSAVFVYSHPNANGTRSDWKGLAAKAHNYMKKIGIDPVAYFHNEDVYSGFEPQKNFIDWIKLRKIENMIFLSERMVNGQKQYQLVITALNPKVEFVEHGQQAWKYQHEDLERLFIILYRITSNSTYKKENFLIVDKPEIFTDIPLHKGKRFEAYQQDLKLDKLAVPRFIQIPVPEQFPDNVFNQEIIREVNRYNNQVEGLNARLEQIMSQYPFSWGFVDLSQKAPDQLRNDGFQFVLYHINTTGRNVKDLLDYRVDKTETSFVSLVASNDGTSIKPISVDLPIHKYYIRHILTNDVFLGTKWDADTNWEQALLNHFTGLKIELKVR